jgi:hypothetical protein
LQDFCGIFHFWTISEDFCTKSYIFDAPTAFSRVPLAFSHAPTLFSRVPNDFDAK